MKIKYFNVYSIIDNIKQIIIPEGIAPILFINNLPGKF